MNTTGMYAVKTLGGIKHENTVKPLIRALTDAHGELTDNAVDSLSNR